MNQPTISIVDDDNNRSVLCGHIGGKNADYDEYFPNRGGAGVWRPPETLRIRVGENRKPETCLDPKC